MKIAILGCGPAGLLAAHAAAQTPGSIALTIFSKPVKSQLGGAQYLHREIPGLNLPSADLHIFQRGSAAGYAEKVYGSAAAPTSWDQFPAGKYQMWNMREMYEHLWSLYSGFIVDWEAKDAARDLTPIVNTYDYVISSIPPQALCMDPEHDFTSEQVNIAYDHPRIEMDRYNFPLVGENVVVYSGEPEDKWYRASRLFGVRSTEFPKDVTPSRHVRPARPPLRQIAKPLATTCDCGTETHMRVGRYGTWTKGVLSHDAYFDVEAFLNEVH